ncbi:MAG: GerMN domain-containing protein [Abditibacteriales bacterium]|nr:GerMN domain-containing protein [Abditibacteriales bacterium]MDW8367210.1 GerMN domain-containing protein [Abditibacteriales bacterium]
MKFFALLRMTTWGIPLLALATLSGCRPKPPTPTKTPPKAPPTAVIYLINAETGRLQPVRVPLETAEDADAAVKARYILTHYLDFTPTQKDLDKPFPPSTRLLDLQVKDTVAVVNFSEAYRTPQWWGGTDHAYLALRALVNTLTELKGIEKVRILIEGKTPEDKDCGGIEDWSQPLERDESLIND